mmetsp:Transcript_23017/g.35628  ORF Transcript_23017/g.35628 Transcript_23017/m.35628 type:complete len:110 (+) Transcript_23017:270-599(+)
MVGEGQEEEDGRARGAAEVAPAGDYGAAEEEAATRGFGGEVHVDHGGTAFDGHTHNCGRSGVCREFVLFVVGIIILKQSSRVFYYSEQKRPASLVRGLSSSLEREPRRG